MPNVELIDRLITHYQQPNTAPLWNWNYCLAATLQRWGELHSLHRVELAAVLGLSFEDVNDVMLGTKFMYQMPDDHHNRALILAWLTAVRNGSERPELHTQAYLDASAVVSSNGTR